MVYGDFFSFFLRAEIFVLTRFGGTMFDFEEKNMTLTHFVAKINCISVKKYFISDFFSYEIIRRNVFIFPPYFFCSLLFKWIFDRID